MQTRTNLKRFGGSVAIMTTAFAGVGFATPPASAATGPTTTVQQGLVTVAGTANRDVIDVAIDALRLTVDVGFDGTIDAQIPRSQFRAVQVLGRRGDDGLVVSGTGQVPVTINGGLGNDFIGVLGAIGDRGDGDAATAVNGQAGNDDVLAATPGAITISTGQGDDSVEGGLAGIGHETVSLGDGNDQFTSSLNAFVGARSDVVDGGAGKDGMEIRGSFSSESLNMVQKSGHLIAEHSFGDEIDSDNIEDVSWVGFGGLDEGGGGDSVSVGDLSGTTVVHVDADFTDPLDELGPNNSADQLRVVGTAGIDRISVSSFDRTDINVVGLTPAVTATNLDHQDTLRIDTLAGHDTVDQSGLPPGLVQVQVF